jgi:hypothetical protein
VYERRHLISRRPRGHLQISKWIRSAAVEPTRYPISVDELSVTNDFARALSVVAGQLSRSVPVGELSARLRQLQVAVMPGEATPSYASPAVAHRALPTQWASYRPAWDLVVSLLRDHSIVGDPGRSIGLEVAVEPWPLLETVLTRSLNTLAPEMGLKVAPKSGYPLLRNLDGSTATRVVPDGALQLGERTVATFECKYTVPGPTPKDSHAHQALSTAAALGAPMAVLIYPNDEPAHKYQVAGFAGKPTTLVTLGVSMYSYRRDIGDVSRAAVIRQLLASVNALPWT